MGRTGNLFSFEKYNVKPDIVCLGKALSSTIPLSAIAAPKKLLKSGHLEFTQVLFRVIQ